MRIAIVSDIHDHDRELKQVLAKLSGIEHMILLGDIVAPTTLVSLMKGFAGKVHMVFGNNDGDILHLAKTDEEFPNLDIYGDFGETEIDGIRIAFVHKPSITHALARSGMYDIVCFGHTHIQHSEIINDTLIINPGAVRPPLQEDHDSSFAIIDTTEPKRVTFKTVS